MKILLIDNFDSFTYNLVHYLESLNCTVEVQRNNAIIWEHLDDADALVLSPGPGLPKDAGALLEVIEKYHRHKPILGVCLGMQALAEFYGDELYNLKAVKHGVQTTITLENTCSLYKDLPNHFEVGLYHSWAVNLKEESPFIATAKDSEGVLMSIRHSHLPLFGVQYHPESIMTEYGIDILKNFLETVGN